LLAELRNADISFIGSILVWALVAFCREEEEQAGDTGTSLA